MYKKIALALLGFVFFIQSTQSQDLKLTVLPVIVSAMAAQDTYESETIGIANAKSKQFERYQQMVQIATDDQLKALAGDHASAVVRLYAYQAMRQRGISIPKNLQQKFKEDTTLVQTIEGCVANKFPLSKLAATPLSAKSNYSRQPFSQMQFVSQ